jgi:hypothetical protein
MALREINDVVGEHAGHLRTVLEYGVLMKQLVDCAKEPGFSVASWAPLAELVAVDEFDRVGPFKEVMDWAAYVGFLTTWAMSSEWNGSFKRISEFSNVVFLELEERSRVGEFSSVVNSLSVYEFNDAGKIRHIDVYLQMALPDPDMLMGYEGVELTE